MTTPDWDLYRAFLAVLETGSLSAAARALGLTQPTIGRQIEALETALGAVLFTRSPGGLRATEAALALRPHAETMASAAQALLRAASGEADQVRGVVRVTASHVVGAEVLPPILTRFHEANPEIVIELALSDRQEDLLRRDADIAVRMVRPTQSALTARRVGTVPVGLFAHRRYLERHGAPARLEPGLSGIGFDRNVEMLSALRDRQLPLTREHFAFRSDSDLAQLAALRAGFGIGGCQYGIARRDPDLVPVLADAFRFDMEVWVAMHEDLKANRRMRLMFDALVEGLRDYVAESRP
ncbi:MAG TPA: LysR family transcriptional regulator [Caulobacteraceae bacterium]|jgi:DNA-binding transcriptional LysR family regulator|nr:LysR family transcriptional regulator [Caulobacteraceae bacterium]